jgi:hypothetical protein
MIPPKINALFEFIDYLDKNRTEYIEKYLPLCNELKQLDNLRHALRPNDNYKDKQSYDNIQKQIAEKFEPITENIYKPIREKLLELRIWSGDDVYSSIWNNNITEIADFRRSFSAEDTNQVFRYKEKYLNFRTKTNSDFLCLSFIFSNLDEILKELFDFFKDSKENEFDSFETKTIEVGSVAEIAQSIKENIGKNLKYSIPTETVFSKKQTIPTSDNVDIKNEFNVFNMGDKIEVGNLSNNSGQIIIGNDNKTKTIDNDEIAQKSFRWQKKHSIIAIIISIIGLVIAYFSIGK